MKSSGNIEHIDKSKHVKVKVFPKSGKSCVDGLRNGLLIVRLKSIPEKGKANTELRKILSQHYSVPPNDISIVRGKTSSTKLVKIGPRKS